ncbi:26475_t:CDS:2, partial [Racocetra persica]
DLSRIMDLIGSAYSKDGFMKNVRIMKTFQKANNFDRPCGKIVVPTTKEITALPCMK